MGRYLSDEGGVVAVLKVFWQHCFGKEVLVYNDEAEA